MGIIRITLQQAQPPTRFCPTPAQENTALVQQLAELQGCCKAFAAEAEGLRAQVARLEGARKGAEGGLAAAQRELEQLRSALR